MSRKGCPSYKCHVERCPSARDIKVVRPIYGVELFDGETARFEVEISEDDVHGLWTLNGDVLSPSSVSPSATSPLWSPLLSLQSLCDV